MFCNQQVVSLSLTAGPIPAPAVHVPNSPEFGGVKTSAAPDDIHELAYELGGTDSGEYHLEPEALDRIIAAAVPAPNVPYGVDEEAHPLGEEGRRALLQSTPQPAAPALPSDTEILNWLEMQRVDVSSIVGCRRPYNFLSVGSDESSSCLRAQCIDKMQPEENKNG